MTRTKRTILLFVLVWLAAMIVLVRLSPWYPSQRDGTIHVTWSDSGNARHASGVVVDSHDNPIAGLPVSVADTSGDHHTTTDAQGRFDVEVGTPELIELQVEDRGTIHWPLAFGLDMTDGIKFKVVVENDN